MCICIDEYRRVACEFVFSHKIYNRKHMIVASLILSVNVYQYRIGQNLVVQGRATIIAIMIILISKKLLSDISVSTNIDVIS